jgi:tetratricopeptide (TPR) repeat protein
MNEIKIAIDLLQLLINNHEDGDSLVRESELKNFCLNKHNYEPNTEEISESVDIINSSVKSKIIIEGWYQSGGFLDMLSAVKESQYLTNYAVSQLSEIIENFNNKINLVDSNIEESEFQELLKFQEKWSTMSLAEKQQIARETDRLNNIGAHYYNEDNFDDAIKYFKMAMKVMPTNNDALKNLIICYKYVGELEKINSITNMLTHLGY